MFEVETAQDAVTMHEFYEAVENIVVSYQFERVSAERAMSAIAAAMADIVETDGGDV